MSRRCSCPTVHEGWKAVARFAEVMGDPAVAASAGSHFTCGEAEAVAALLRAVGHPDAADRWLAGHAEGDEPDDAHYGQAAR